MRLSKLVLVFSIFSSSVFAQSEDASFESAMMSIVKPEFKGITENIGIKEFLQQNLYYPFNAYKTGIEGTVVIRFNVLPTGNLSELQVIHSVSNIIDDDVIDVLKASKGMWKPGTINGLPVPMEKEVSVLYKIERSGMYTTAQLNKNKGDKLLKEGKYSRAIKLYSRSIDIYPVYDLTIYRRGLAKYYSGDLEGALNDFERVADLDSQLADPMLTKLDAVEDFIESELQLSSLIY
ncbi:MAG: TonB family protein [Bacteroidetes bacterium]|nr:TonB family protein [Bacteroidota bacterium]